MGAIPHINNDSSRANSTKSPLKKPALSTKSFFHHDIAILYLIQTLMIFDSQYIYIYLFVYILSISSNSNFLSKNNPSTYTLRVTKITLQHLLRVIKMTLKMHLKGNKKNKLLNNMIRVVENDHKIYTPHMCRVM